MPKLSSPVIVDGLWRCLCPSFDAVFFSRGLSIGLHRPSPAAPISLSTVRPAIHQFGGFRFASTIASDSRASRGAKDHDEYIEKSLKSYREVFEHQNENPVNDPTHHTVIHELPLERIYAILRSKAQRGHTHRVRQIVEHLVKDRHENPSLKHFSALILSNVSPSGSAFEVGALLEELHDARLEPDSGLCHDVLRVLAVHPDYLIRNQIIGYMEQRWLTLSTEGHNDLVAGLLRERQFELALETLNTMIQKGIQVQPWLYDMATFYFLEFDEVDQALSLVKFRVSCGLDEKISPLLWYLLLDVASKSYHHEAARYVWERRVQIDRLHPTAGTCLNVLATAARHGDWQVATDVFRILTNRKTVFESQHYEMLIDTWIMSGHSDAALSVLSVMCKARVPVDEGATRSILEYLKRDQSRPAQAFSRLQSLRAENLLVPVAAVNCIIEASVHFEDLENALEQYKALHAICDSGPNTTTFNILFRGCRIARRKDLAMFLASEMRALKVQPDALTYDRLLLICLEQADFDDAFSYYEEMTGLGFEPRSGTVMALAEHLFQSCDPRYSLLFRDMEKWNMPTMGLRRKLGISLITGTKLEADDIAPPTEPKTVDLQAHIA